MYTDFVKINDFLKEEEEKENHDIEQENKIKY